MGGYGEVVRGRLLGLGEERGVVSMVTFNLIYLIQESPDLHTRIPSKLISGKEKGKKRKQNLPAAQARYHVRLAPPSIQLMSKSSLAKKSQLCCGSMSARLA